MEGGGGSRHDFENILFSHSCAFRDLISRKNMDFRHANGWSAVDNNIFYQRNIRESKNRDVLVIVHDLLDHYYYCSRPKRNQQTLAEPRPNYYIAGLGVAIYHLKEWKEDSVAMRRH